MAGSIGDVNVRITTDAGGVGPAVAQAQRQFRQFQQTASQGMANVQGVAQQAVFAVDDFFAAFATGGVAGGIRGAANNLTLIASMLGGVKVQLAAIAAVTIGGFLAKQFLDAKEKAKDLADAVRDIAHASKEAAQGRANARELAGLWGAGAVPEMDLPAVRAERERNAAAFKQNQESLREAAARAKETAQARDNLRSQALIEEADPSRWSKEVKQSVEDAERAAKAAATEVEHRKAVIASVNEQAYALQKLQRVREVEDRRRGHRGADGVFDPFISARERRATQLAFEDASVEVEAMRESIRSRRGQYITSMFGNMPTANAFGSVGAISAVNTATAGSMNARDSLTRNTEEMKRDIRILRELEQKKKEVAIEVIGIP